MEAATARMRLAVLAIFSIAAASEWTAGHIQECKPWDPRMNPTHEVYRGQDVVWQIPADPKAVLFLAHGAGKDAFAFFDSRPGCPRCYGLPEDRQAVLDALARGYAVLALKSRGNAWETLPLDAPAGDLAIAAGLIDSWTRTHDLDRVPLLAWGHSSGGMFVSSLSFRAPVQALVVMCSHPLLELLEVVSPAQFPPIFFAHMAGDLPNVARVENWMAVLSGAGVSVAEKRCHRMRPTAHFFAERISCLGNASAMKIYDALIAEGLLDMGGYLRRNPLGFDWKFLVTKWAALDFCSDFGALCLLPQVVEELQIAFGVHSFTSCADDEIFSWVETTWAEESTAVSDVSLRRHSRVDESYHILHARDG